MSHPPHLQLLPTRQAPKPVEEPLLQRIRIGDRSLTLVSGEELAPMGNVQKLLWEAPFIPRPELQTLHNWLNSAESISMRVVVGPSLSGKTRLAAELCQKVASSWHCGFWRQEQPQSSQRASGQRKIASIVMDRATLIIVDNAQEQAEALSGWLCELARNPGGVSHRLRVLFLADHGDPTWGWWRDLLGSAGRNRLLLTQFFDYATEEPLSSPLVGLDKRHQMLGWLLTQTLPNQEAIKAPFDPEAAIAAGLAQADWSDDPYYLWMLAFVAAQRLAKHDAQSIAAKQIEAELKPLLNPTANALEVALGAALADWLSAALEPEMVRAAQDLVLINTLCNGLEETTLVEQVGQLDETPMSQEQRQRLRMVARRLHNQLSPLYAWPPAGDGRWPPLGPDPLAAAFITHQLQNMAESRQQRLLQAAMEVGGKWPLLQLGYCIHAELPDERYKLLSARIAELALDERLSLTDLMDLADGMPNGFGPMTELELKILRHLTDSLEQQVAGDSSHTYYPAWGHYLNMLSYVLSYLHQEKEALAAAERSVEIFEDLVLEAPDVFEPDLADALFTCGLRHEEMGRLPRATELKQQAEKLFEQLAIRDPETFTSGWARALNSLGVSLSTHGDKAEAERYCARSISLFERLSRIQPSQFAGDHAAALNNYSNVLKECGKNEQALEQVSRAAELYTHLSDQDSLNHAPNMVKSYSNMAFLLADMERDQEAVEVGERAYRMSSNLMAREPTLYSPFHAELCEQYSKPLYRSGQLQRGIRMLREAVELYRELAITNPLYYEERLATASYMLSDACFEGGHLDEALESIQITVDLFEKLVRRDPQDIQPMLAMALHNLAVLHAHKGESEASVRAIRRTIGLYQSMSSYDSSYQVPLIQAHDALALFLRDEGRYSEACQSAGQALSMLQHYEEKLSAGDYEMLAPGVFRNRWVLCQEVGNREGALEAAALLKDVHLRRYKQEPSEQEIVALGEAWEVVIQLLSDQQHDLVTAQRELGQASLFCQQELGPKSLAPELAAPWQRAQANLQMVAAGLQLQQGEREQALALIEQSVEQLGALTEQDPIRFGPDLAKACCDAAETLHELDQQDASIAHRLRAVAQFNQLVEAGEQSFLPSIAAEKVNLASQLGGARGEVQQALEHLSDAAQIWPRCVAQNPATIEPLWVRTLELMAAMQHRLGLMSQRRESMQQLVALHDTLTHTSADGRYAAKLTLAEILAEEQGGEEDPHATLLHAAGMLQPLEQEISDTQQGHRLAEVLILFAERAFNHEMMALCQDLVRRAERVIVRHGTGDMNLQVTVRRARNFQRCAQYLVQSQHYVEALEMASKAVAISNPIMQDEGGSNTILRPFVAVNYHQYALCLMLVGQYSAVEPMARQALMLMYDAFLSDADELRSGLESLLSSYDSLLQHIREAGVVVDEDAEWLDPIRRSLDKHEIEVETASRGAGLPNLFRRIFKRE
uniref:MalT-like TPR region domain-containing protein n=1 Tax=Magnetococcus massalia (strain MO-1) TaxID=451514 RepID=A0A1S7LJN3_MAGMO|nr:conserved protein of unknown function [Include 10 TPR repeats] [Candidatus Magnetococcus massalia]